MGREFRLFESKPSVIELTDGELFPLESLGRELSSSRSWWGHNVTDESRSVIGIDRMRDGRARINFRDVVGVVRVGSTQIHVSPKIPLNHFQYIASHSVLAPRLSSSEVSVTEGSGFVDLLARWCVDAAEKLLHRGLRKDYKNFTEPSAEMRGEVLPVETALSIYSGKLEVYCTFQELSEDMALNRVIKSACEQISRLDLVNLGTRNRARQIVYRMGGVGDATLADRLVKIDRLTASYEKAFPLSLLVLNGLGISANSGLNRGVAFLIRTPELIEDGLRAILAAELAEHKVAKRRLMLGESGLSINPDLVFGDNFAIGDVKYRYLSKDWSKPDLNQLITFATGFRAVRAGLFGFVEQADSAVPREVQIGPVTARVIGWMVDEKYTPLLSAQKMATEVKHWLKDVPTRQSRITSSQ